MSALERIRSTLAAPGGAHLGDLDSPGHDLAESIRAKYSELKHTHPNDDVRRAMMNVLGACATVPLRPSGGVYWVPAPYAETMRRLQGAVEQIGSSRVYLLPVHYELAAMKAEVEQFLSSPPERASTLVRRLDSFDELRARAELYKSELSVTVADLDQTLSSLTASVESLLNQKAAA